MRRPRPRTVRALAASLVWIAGLVPLQGQEASESATAPRLRLLTDFDFHLSLEHLGSDDPRFVWDAEYGGDIDLLDYGVGRVNFLANFEAILGEEFRRFDPNQGNYILDISGSARLDQVELALVFHHISRHLSDRPKRFAIDWNMVGVQAFTPLTWRSTRIDLRGRALWTIKRSFVDYRADYGADVAVRHPVRPRVSVIGSGGFTVMPVEAGLFGRGTQAGSRLEGGIRVEGDRAAMEFFVAFERRIDASPLDARTRSWGLVGLRFLGP